MRCIKCGGETETVNTRIRNAEYVWRRKKCIECGAVFSSYELPDEVIQAMIEMLDIKKKEIMQIEKRLPPKKSIDADRNTKTEDDHF